MEGVTQRTLRLCRGRITELRTAAPSAPCHIDPGTTLGMLGTVLGAQSPDLDTDAMQ